MNQGEVEILNLIVESGGTLWLGDDKDAEDIDVHGDIICNGIIGGESKDDDDALTLNLVGASTTISGTGSCMFKQIIKNSNQYSLTELVIDMPVELVDDGTALYNKKNNTELKVRITPNGILDIAGTFDMNNGNSNKLCSLLIESDETGTGILKAKAITDSDASNTTVEQYLQENRWHYITTPVESATAGVFMDIYLMEFSEPDGTWSYITDPAALLSPEMEGYAAWTSSNLLGNTTLEFSGEIHSGNYEIGLTNTASATHNNKGFNFVGNPYNAPVDWDYEDDKGWTKENIDDAIYLWNGDLGVYGSYVNGFGINQATSIIPAHQGFFVHCNASTGTLGVDYKAQVAQPASFWKNSNEVTEGVLRLAVTGQGYQDETIIYFDGEASGMVDKSKDAIKMFNAADAVSLYSFSGGQELAINGLPDVNHVMMGMKSNTTGWYTLTWDGAGSFVNYSQVILEDKETGMMIDMKAGNSYSFNHTGNSAERFTVHFVNTTTGVEDFVKAVVPVTVNQGNLVIDNTNGTIDRLGVYNLAGQEVVVMNPGAGIQEVQLPGSGWYIVRISDGQEIRSEKIWVN
ncbi:MAG: hypothetical protein Kow00127_10240 [Bacteroidales bacterium]